MRSLPWLIVALIAAYMGFSNTLSIDWTLGKLKGNWLLIGGSIIPFLMACRFLREGYKHWLVLREADDARKELEKAENSSNAYQIAAIINNVEARAEHCILTKAWLGEKKSALKERITFLRKAQATREIDTTARKALLEIPDFLERTKADLPIFRARRLLHSSLESLETRRVELQDQWDAAYSQFNWWNKLKYGSGPDFSELDRILKDLRAMDRELKRKHGDDFVVIEKHFKALKEQAISRVQNAKREAEAYVQESRSEERLGKGVLHKAMWLSMLSVPVSVWADANRASNVFDALRGVNGNFTGLSDSEIWWETLFMPAESLAGLAALTKGAYFEQLVAADTGGQLHEHFNQPDTDIVVDGTAFQIKATDSESYVNSVVEGIPVISTSEIALATGSIDSGYSNEELGNAIDLALGGTVVDVGDTAVDAILAGVGGLGFFATLQGFNHAVKKHENGGDGVEAIFEGAGVAIEGTARALVGAAEMGYKVLSSKPSRFVGRMMLKGLVKLDEKMTGQPDRK
ncbi:hypothetical protein LL254_15975 [Marinobacter nauticus]|uniref:hypothetical protein n=1 Tax=Marinobacter nauticus TaxID=2743 RepID=UPI001D180C62|nr:hypothetical protein [Marinobacter nauticus]MCC4272206.1 hypothetical protein [Marinobacter nauticus]